MSFLEGFYYRYLNKCFARDTWKSILSVVLDYLSIGLAVSLFLCGLVAVFQYSLALVDFFWADIATNYHFNYPFEEALTKTIVKIGALVWSILLYGLFVIGLIRYKSVLSSIRAWVKETAQYSETNNSPK